ncbi:MAG TPA: SAM-dependent methyltransferase, partial [Mycobacterium sp.]|nr:SAM-dependent methyltransferase [Mycobacterium sp.]
GFDPSQLPQCADLAAIDVSFISLRLVLPTAISLLHSGGTILALVKPQFEVGKGEVGKGGVVRDPAQHRAVVEAIRQLGVRSGLECRGEYVSPILGPKGNREFFLYFGVCSPP